MENKCFHSYLKCKSVSVHMLFPNDTIMYLVKKNIAGPVTLSRILKSSEEAYWNSGYVTGSMGWKSGQKDKIIKNDIDLPGTSPPAVCLLWSICFLSLTSLSLFPTPSCCLVVN